MTIVYSTVLFVVDLKWSQDGGIECLGPVAGTQHFVYSVPMKVLINCVPMEYYALSNSYKAEGKKASKQVNVRSREIYASNGCLKKKSVF